MSKALVFFLIFLSATQLGKHFWPEFAFVYGTRVDYLAPAIYLLDIASVLTIFMFREKLGKALTTLSPLILFLSLLTLTSSIPAVSLIYAGRIILYSLAIFTLPKNKETIIAALTSTVAFQLALGTLQIVKGASLGGLFYLLGERSLSPSLPNIATFEVAGRTLLRAYGTFSHPNVLAGFSLLSLIIIWKLSKRRKARLVSLTLAALSMLITQSALATLSLILFLLLHSFLKGEKNMQKAAWAVLVILLLLFLSQEPKRSVSERLLLQSTSFKIVEASPLFGAGPNATIPMYKHVSPAIRLLQPDHNLLTLTLAQTGLFGLACLYVLSKRSSLEGKTLIALSPIVLGDHYLLTSIQGLFILILLLSTKK